LREDMCQGMTSELAEKLILVSDREPHGLKPIRFT
jgi:hypothetical protein